MGLNRVKTGRSEGGGGQIKNRRPFCETEMFKKEMLGCGNRNFGLRQLTVEELVGHSSYQLIPRVRTLRLHLDILRNRNGFVERGMFQNAEHIQNEKCGALKMREFLNT